MTLTLDQEQSEAPQSDRLRAVAVLGAGRVGTALARQGGRSGLRMLVAASDDPERIRLTMSVLAPGAEVAWARDAVERADLVVLAVPFHDLGGIDPGLLSGRVVVDAMNLWEPIDGPAEDLLRGSRTSSERTAATLPGARVVKTLNHIGYHDMEDDARPAGAPDRRAVAVASDDVDAARLAAVLVDRLGFDPVLMDSLQAGAALEPGSDVFEGEFDLERLRELLRTTGRTTAR